MRKIHGDAIKCILVIRNDAICNVMERHARQAAAITLEKRAGNLGDMQTIVPFFVAVRQEGCDGVMRYVWQYVNEGGGDDGTSSSPSGPRLVMASGGQIGMATRRLVQ